MQSQPSSRPFLKYFLILVFLGMCVYGLMTFFNKTQQDAVQTISREGVIQQIETLNQLETLAFQIDTIVTSKKQGSWQRLWQDEQKGIFIVRGKVVAGVDLDQITPEDVEVDQQQQSAQLRLPAAKVLHLYLDDIEVYDIETGAFGLMEVDSSLFEKVQQTAKDELMSKACQADILAMAATNAQKQIQTLFDMTKKNVNVTITDDSSCD